MNQSSENQIAMNVAETQTALRKSEQAYWVVRQNQKIQLVPAVGGKMNGHLAGLDGDMVGYLPPLSAQSLGDPSFCQTYDTRWAYYTGAMANGIASEQLVIALGKAGLMGSFGAAGLGPDRVESAIHEIQDALGDAPYAFNLINSPSDPAAENRSAELYLKHQVRTVEASAYVDLTVPLVYYRVAGLVGDGEGNIHAQNRVIAKLSRREVAKLFLQPAPADILNRLLEEGKITHAQAEMAQRMPIADDITVEADSGGHTDNRPLVCLMPGIVALRDELQAQYQYATEVRIGAGGGISTPEAALAAYMMGAAYIVTGSVNQACVEAGTSAHTRKLLAQAGMADVAMAPASDMFEMGVRVQVLKRGTLFPMRAQKLWEIYDTYHSWEEVPQAEREKLEKTIFKRSFAEIWEGTEAFFAQRDPRQNERAAKDPHHKMALVFRWYLGLSSRWSNGGEAGREMDYQIWCGPAMGAFNDWVRGSYLAQPENRRVVTVAQEILQGAAYLARLRSLNLMGVQMPALAAVYRPMGEGAAVTG